MVKPTRLKPTLKELHKKPLAKTPLKNLKNQKHTQ